MLSYMQVQIRIWWGYIEGLITEFECVTMSYGNRVQLFGDYNTRVLVALVGLKMKMDSFLFSMSAVL